MTGGPDDCGCGPDGVTLRPPGRPPISAVVLAVGAVVAFGAAFGALLWGQDLRWWGTAGGLGIAALGAALAAWAHHLAGMSMDEEPRHYQGPGLGRRRLILGAGAGAAAAAAVAVAFPASRRVADANQDLRRTAWHDGARAVDADGAPVRAEDIVAGELVTAYPEGAAGQIDSQAVLIRVEPERFVPDAERPDWTVDGIVAYSKLCTHMACPLGLYQSETATLLCPCHQAVFDVLDGGRAVAGPARRALPQLPLRLDDDGTIVARGDFSEPVGTGFWERPS